jgi:hypothetical protein
MSFTGPSGKELTMTLQPHIATEIEDRPKTVEHRGL